MSCNQANCELFWFENLIANLFDLLDYWFLVLSVSYIIFSCNQFSRHTDSQRISHTLSLHTLMFFFINIIIISNIRTLSTYSVILIACKSEFVIFFWQSSDAKFVMMYFILKTSANETERSQLKNQETYMICCLWEL